MEINRRQLDPRLVNAEIRRLETEWPDLINLIKEWVNNNIETSQRQKAYNFEIKGIAGALLQEKEKNPGWEGEEELLEQVMKQDYELPAPQVPRALSPQQIEEEMARIAREPRRKEEPVSEEEILAQAADAADERVKSDAARANSPSVLKKIQAAFQDLGKPKRLS